MERIDNTDNSEKERQRESFGCFFDDDEKSKGRRRISKVFVGLSIVAAGVLLLLHRTGVEVPDWIISWPMVLIVAGIASGIKRGFKRASAYVLIAVGLLFLADHMFMDIELKPYAWPVFIMVVGLIIIFKPRRHRYFRNKRDELQEEWQQYHEKKKYNMNSDDFIGINAAFGTVQRNVISKNFKGGEVNAVFGGVELNLSQADIDGTVPLELNQIFGGTKLIVPANWKIRSEQSAVFGGIEDKREILPASAVSENKILLLKGSCVFGGIDIRSH